MVSENDINRIRLFSEGNVNKQEVQYIYSVFSNNENSSELQQTLRDNFFEYVINNEDSKQDIFYLLDRIHHVIHKNERKTKNTIIKIIYRRFSLAAAVLIIPLLITVSILFKEKEPEIKVAEENYVTSVLYAPPSSRINFTLPDGTEGWLNSGSSLEYKTPFRNRSISVLGEAWFDVAHDEEHPFEIAVGNSRIKVLGTRFNLFAYPEEKYIEVVLEEGKVEFSSPELSSAVEMNPNEKLTLKEGAISIDNIDASKYTVWTEGKLVFRSDPMTEVAKRLARWYNVEVELVDKALYDYVIRGTFQDDSLEEVLHFLSMTSPIKYKIVEHKLLDDNSVQKKKIFLYLK